MGRALYLWLTLLSIRFFFLFSGGYIHPDEFFQNPQIVAQVLFPDLYPAYWTWEWDVKTPIRSVVGPFLTSGMALYLSKYLPNANSTWGILFLSRLGPFLFSLVIDLIIIFGSFPSKVKVDRTLLLLLHSSSWSTIILLCRPFLNSFISIIYALCIYLTIKIFFSSGEPKPILPTLLGALLTIGIWSHSSFILFLIPIVMWNAIRSLAFPRIIAYIGGGAVPLFCFFIVIDYLFNEHHLVFPLINNFSYNASPDNLAIHGLHPLYLHVCVNMFLLFGPGYVLYLRSLGSFSLFQGSFILIPLALLSLVPHQEVRFLLPLSFPVFIGISTIAVIKNKKLFGIIWCIFNLFFILIFGVFHQRGVVMGLDYARTYQVETVYGYSVYMLPNYMVAPATLVCNYPEGGSPLKNNSILIVPEIYRERFNLTNASLLRSVVHLDLDLVRHIVTPISVRSVLTCDIYLIR